MTKKSIILRYITLLLLILTSAEAYTQCSTEIRAIRDTIACGESVLLENITLSNSATSDNFSGSTLGGLWNAPGSVSAGWTLTSPCGATPTGQNLWFAQGSVIPRRATTANIDASCGGTISFDFRMETQSPPPCDGPDQMNEAIELQYRNNTTGSGWQNITTFLPGFAFTGWNNYSYPIPAGAIAGGPGNQVQFRWIQFNASSPTYDLWGIDNVDITLAPPCGTPFTTNFYGPNVPFGYSLDTITVSPVTDSAVYSVYVSNGQSTCTDSITIYVEQPTIVATTISSPCAGTDTLNAQATIPSNCYYYLELKNYSGSGNPSDGWSVAGSNPPIFHKVSVNVDKFLINNFTMLSGGQLQTVLEPIPVTDGDLLETYFQSAGGGANECSFKIFESDGITVAQTGSGNQASTPPGMQPLNTYFNTHLQFTVVNGGSGYNTPPFTLANPAPIITLSGGGCTVDTIFASGVAWNPPPTGGVISNVISQYNGITNAATGCDGSPVNVTVTGGGGSGAIITATVVDDAVHVSCPATATYNYSWINQTAGGTVGLSDPTVQNPTVTVATPTYFQVTAYDSLNPACNVDTALFVPGSPGNGNFTISISGTNPMCSNGTPNIDVTIESLSTPAITSGNFFCDIIDGNGNTLVTGYPIDGTTLPLTFPLSMFPGILPSPLTAGSYTFTVTNMVDDTSPNPCPIAVNNPTHTIDVNDPYADGTPPSSPIDLCTSDPITNLLYMSWITAPDANGTWSYAGPTFPAPAGSNLPFIGFNYDLDPGLFAPGLNYFQYVVPSVQGCPTPITSLVTVDITSAPNAGILNLGTNPICENDPLLLPSFDLYTLFNAPGAWPNPPSPDFYDVTGGGNTQILNPNTWSPTAGVYDIENRAPAQGGCPQDVASIQITVLAQPTANIGVDDPDNTICMADQIYFEFTNLSGTPNYTINYNDPNGPQQVIIDALGNDLTGNPIQIFPALGNNMYTITNISDQNCSSTISSSVSVMVLAGPVAGTGGSHVVCEDDFSIYNMGFGGAFFPAGGDAGGSWQYQGTTPHPSGSFTAWNPTTNSPVDPFGMYEYTVVDPTSTCPPATTQITISPETPPNTGIATNDDICINVYSSTSPYNLNNLLDGSQDPGGSWHYNSAGAQIAGGLIDPTTYGVGNHNFSYQIGGPLNPPYAGICDNNMSLPYETQGVLSIHPVPVANTITATSPVAQGTASNITVTMGVGTPPFTVTIQGNETPSSSNIFNITSGMTNITPWAHIPNYDPNVNPVDLEIVSIIDDWGCIATATGISAPVIVDPYPLITASISDPNPCEGDIVNLTLTGTQGAYPLTVFYTIGTTTQTAVIQDPAFNPPTVIDVTLSTGWNVTGSNAIIITQISDNAPVTNYCPASLLPSAIFVDVNPRPIISSFTIIDPEICEGDDAIIEFSFSEGTPPFDVNIIDQNLLGTAISGLTGMSAQQHTISPNLTATIPPYPLPYTYTVTNYSDANNCTGTSIPPNVNVTVHPVPVISISPFLRGSEICEGDNIGIGLSVNANIYASPPVYTVEITGTPSGSWTKDINENGIIVNGSGSGDSIQANPTVTTTYTITTFEDPLTQCGTIDPVSNSATLTVNPSPKVDILSTADSSEICYGDNSYIEFIFTDGTSPWSVSFLSNSFPITLGPWHDTTILQQNPPLGTNYYDFEYITDGKQCSTQIFDEFEIVVNPLPTAIFTADNRFICKDDTSKATLNFEVSSSTNPNLFKVMYTLNGNEIIIPDSIGYIHTIETNSTGVYNISSVIDRKGCEAIELGDSITIIANPLPNASFMFYPEPTDIDDPFITFINNSEGNSTSIWTGYTLENNNITAGSYWSDTLNANNSFVHEFPAKADTHYVFLQVISDSGCVHVHADTVIIDQSFWFYTPEAFTPDNDLINDYFLPIINGITEYKLTIYTRGGERVFETTEYISESCPGGCDQEELEALILNCVTGCNSAWDGKINNSYAPAGNYVFNIVLVDINGKTITKNGSILLIR